MKIFISSTSHDLNDFRALIVDRLEKRGHEVIYHESPTFPANTGLHSHDHCIKAINHSDIVLCIIDKRYGGIYEGKFNFRIDPFTIKAGNNELEITVPTERLSITWCELIEAYNLNKQVMTFARQRTLDEKHTRRKNQNLLDFKPAYVQANEVFDLIDWITKKKTNNWIASFENIVDFEKKLEIWITEVEKSLVFASSDSEDPQDPLIEASIVEKNDENMFAIETMIGEDLEVEDKKKSEYGDYIVKEGKQKYLFQVKNLKFKNRITIFVESDFDRFVINIIVRKLKLNSEVKIVVIQGSFLQVRNIPEFFDSYIGSFNTALVVLNKSKFETARDSLSVLDEKLGGNMYGADPAIEDWLLVGLPEYSKETMAFILGDPKKRKSFMSVSNQGDLVKIFNLNRATKSSNSLKEFTTGVKNIDIDINIDTNQKF